MEGAGERFREAFHADQSQGRFLPLEHYRRRFPGHEEEVAREYEALVADVPAAPGEAASEETITGLLHRLYAGVPAVDAASPSSMSALLKRLARPGREPYRHEGEIARGGMGAIVRIRDETLRRDLAMKVILDERVGDGSSDEARAFLARFVEEAQVTAQLDHPGVVPVHELGLDDRGRLFFTMKLVKGRTLDEIFRLARAGKGDWSVPRVLQLFARVCETLAYAHSKRVVHRDLKPANVMVGAFGEVYVMDWGLAKALGPDGGGAGTLGHSVVETERSAPSSDSRSPELTVAGAVLGTPAYMPLEQALGREIDERSDVYALGAMLYQLLAGHAPYGEPERKRTASDVLLAVVNGPPAPLRALAPKAPPELLAIVEKAMAREPRDRYATAAALGDDLRLFLEGRAVTAYRTGAWVELRKWIHRNRPLAAAIGAAFLLLGAGLAVSQGLYREARQQKGVAERQRTEAHRQAYRAQLAAAAGHLRDDNVRLARESLEGWGEPLRRWEWHHLHAALDDSVVALSSDRLHAFEAATGRLLLGRSAEVLAWDPADDSIESVEVVEVAGHGSLHISPDGAYSSEPFGPRDAPWLRVRERRTGRVVWEAAGAHWPQSAFCHGAPLLVYHAGGSLHIVDLSVPRLVVSKPLDQEPILAFHPQHLVRHTNGSRAAQESWNLEVLDPRTLEVRAHLEGHQDGVWGASVRPDGGRIVTTSFDRSVRLWDPATGTPADWQTAYPHTTEGHCVLIAPDAAQIATGGKDDTVYFLDAKTASITRKLHGGMEPIEGLRYSHDGRWLATLDRGDTVRVWPTDDSLTVLRGHASYVYAAAFSPDGARLVTGAWDGHVHKGGCLRLWDVATGSPIASWGSVDEIAVWAAFSPDGASLAACVTRRDTWFLRGELRLWDAATGGQRAAFPTGPFYGRAAFSPDGRTLVYDTGDGQALVVDIDSGARRATLAFAKATKDRTMRGLAFSPDGRWIATTREGDRVQIWDARTFEPHREVDPGGGRVWSIAFRTDGDRFVTATADRSARIWDTRTGSLRNEIKSSRQEPLCAIYGPGDEMVVTGDRDGAIRLWDAEDGTEVLHLRGHTAYVFSLAFSPDGRILASASGDGTVRLWDTRTVRDRYLARIERDRLVAELEPEVGRLFEELGDPAAVVERIRARDGDRPREVALQLAFARAIGR